MSRQVDILIEEHLFQRKPDPHRPGMVMDGKLSVMARPFSSSIAAAWLVVERITSPPRTLREAERAANSRFAFWWRTADIWAMDAEEAATTICEAALEAKGIQIPPEEE